MENFPSLMISQEDFQKLSHLLSDQKQNMSPEPHVATLLQEELERAKLVPITELPLDIVCMNSEVSFVDLDTGKKQTLILSYPSEADINSGRVSVFAPVGAALLGLRVGQSINWPISEEKLRRIRVVHCFRHEL